MECITDKSEILQARILLANVGTSLPYLSLVGNRCGLVRKYNPSSNVCIYMNSPFPSLSLSNNPFGALGVDTITM